MKAKVLGLLVLVGFGGIQVGLAQSSLCTNRGSMIIISNRLCAGFNLVANPLVAVDHFGVVDQRINNVLRLLPDGSTLQKWPVGGWGFLPSDVYFFPIGWFDLMGMPSTTTLDLYEGAFVEVPSPATISIFGWIPDPAHCPAPPLPCGWSLRSCPFGMSFTDCTPGPNDGDVVLFWDCVRQEYEPPFLYMVPLGWIDASGIPSTPSPAMGEAFFYHHVCP